MSKRAHWGSRLGFIMAVAGSAVGLANIWRLPYVVGENGGAAFLAVYLLCLLLIGFPVFMAEIVIGRTTQLSPGKAFEQIGGGRFWSWIGHGTIVTGFLVSAFYSAVAGWILGYLIESVRGNVTNLHHVGEAVSHYNSLIENPFWGVGFHALFLLICIAVLYLGVRNGIERGNKIMMPLLFVVLILLVVKGVTLPNAMDGIRYLLSPDWSELTAKSVMIALGQAFFTLSLGQGTMVTYGSYLNKNENLIKSCFPVVLVDTGVSLLAAVAVFSIVFAGGMKPDSGPGLIFHTLPIVFSQLPGGYLFAVMFFLLVLLAAVTSQISAMEPTIAYFQDELGWSRHFSTAVCGSMVFIFGIPCALSSSFLKDYTIFDLNFLQFMEMICGNILIPLGGFFAVILVGWFWGTHNSIEQLKQGASDLFHSKPWLKTYFWFCFKYAAPILMLIVFINALGLFA
jgi:neurotransmitter:Na+ symporter, NSS family